MRTGSFKSLVAEAADYLVKHPLLDDHAAEDVRKLFGTRVKVVATIEDVVNHIDHAVRIAGIDHVGIGSDFDGVSGPPIGLEDISKMPALVDSQSRAMVIRCQVPILGQVVIRNLDHFKPCCANDWHDSEGIHRHPYALQPDRCVGATRRSLHG